MCGLPELGIETIEDCQVIKGLRFPSWIKYRQLIVTGPPGSGKTTLINRIGGWPEEGYVDLAFKGWWKTQSLALRPREIHLGFPFLGRKNTLALFDAEWLENWSQLELDFSRMQLPPPKRWLLSVNWRSRFVFEFQLPQPEAVFGFREARAALGTHPVDEHINLAQIKRQVELFALTAQYFHRNGIAVYIRQELDGPPFRFSESGEGSQNGR